MQTLPDAFKPLASCKQFILWILTERDGKQVKLPVDYRTAAVGDAHDPAMWMDGQTAIDTAKLYGDGYGVGFVFTRDDPFFFVDLDKCLEPDDATWSPVAMDIISMLPGAAIEVSQSSRGLHIICQGNVPDHACKNIPLGLELYTEGRFVALTGTNAVGSASVDHSAISSVLVAKYFPPKTVVNPTTWTNEPVAQWTGSDNDEELLKKALASTSAGGVFGGRCSFVDLWERNVEALAESYAPDGSDNGEFDESTADAALAQHLAFWTGNNCERISKLMWLSGLVRDKWTSHKSYLHNTIIKAVSMQETVYSVGGDVDDAIADQFGGVKLRANSDAQRAYATNVRAEKLAECMGDEELILKFCKVPTAKFWLNNKDKTVEEINQSLTPVESAVNPIGADLNEPTVVNGYQYLGATQQIEYFKGCAYIQDLHRIFTPSGALLKSEQFNATYGGYCFQLDDGGEKTTRKAWEAFTESQIIRYPMAETICFRPELQPGELIKEENRTLVNTYVPIDTPRKPGDASPFLTHLSKVLPHESDRQILLAYMAACIQHKGVKFQWCPLIQGTPGNGKTLFTRCVAAAVGKRYTHMPKADDIDNKFNGWMLNKLFIGVEDIFVADHRNEVMQALLPMITNDELEIQLKGVDQITMSVCANFIINMNDKSGVRKTRNDRRFAVFYTAQQTVDDIARDGMSGDYFPNLYRWLKTGGYAIVTDYLTSYSIPNELNPAGACHRAPDTTSTKEAMVASMGGIEQEIQEAIEEDRPGFAGGWVSSVAVERLLQSTHSARAIPHNKRRDLMQSLGYDWHPALNNGRVNNPIPMDDGKKPRLFIRNGHISANIQTPAEVVRVYQEAQGAINMQAARVFS
ncbi:MAG: hypothetical protein JRJ62_00240 [Deltaproteobacteria bacterium]|nr:hypothetical protein [Deltaproteobacteria bacterium]